jgi:PAS domain-containing protein
MGPDFLVGVALGLTAILAACGALLLAAAGQGARPGQMRGLFDEADPKTLFLFDGETLLDSTPGGRAVLQSSPSQGNAWSRLVAYLGNLFPDVETHLADLRHSGVVTLSGRDQAGQPVLMRAELRGGMTRISLTDSTGGPADPATDPLVHRALADEMAALRSMLAQAPLLAWRERENGDVIWANTAYVMRATEKLDPGAELSWPLPQLFGKLATSQGTTGQRQSLTAADGATHWFELTSVPDPLGRRVYATPCDSAVQAETTLRDFVQTLTRTFAHLPIGLAIFDSSRKLQLFNPALLDLTGLPPDFLAMRPSLRAVLDALRDRGIVPEPKDYHDWRRQIIDLEQSASLGVFEENWTLATGQTYRVVGRPHPSGAIAFMLEDISTEVSRTRRYRADLELGQSVIDTMDEAIAVFSGSGTLVMSNAAYAGLWGHDPSESLTDLGIESISGYWRQSTAPGTLWSEVEDFICTIGDREAWTAEARLLDGRLLTCRFVPLSGGVTLVGFREMLRKGASQRAPARAAR